MGIRKTRNKLKKKIYWTVTAVLFSIIAPLSIYATIEIAAFVVKSVSKQVNR